MFELKSSKLFCGLIIQAYIIGVTFTPNWLALDTNATKFMVLSALNLVCFGMFLTAKEVQQEGSAAIDFFRTAPSLLYTGFLSVSLLSMTQSVNHLESVFSFAKLFSVFSAVFILSVILMRDMRHIRLIIFSMTALLLFDALSVFYNIILLIQGAINDIAEIKTIYSNKNILASSLFLKLPFALWLLVFEQGWKRRIGWFVLLAGMLAIFFISTRAFYLGLIVFSSAFLFFSAIDYYQKREPGMLKAAVSCTGALILAFLIYSAIQGGLYPASDSRYTVDVPTRMASIQDDAIESPRKESWLWTLDMIREKPLLGVGCGNWKITILKYENQKSHDFIYHYKSHNDFLENTAETGIIGGLLFLSIFFAVGWNFLRCYHKQTASQNSLFQALFLAGAGLACYAIDAAFNFPADRPEILLLFSVFLSIGIAASRWQGLPGKSADSINACAVKKPGGNQNDGLKTSAPAEKRRNAISARRIIACFAFLLMLGASCIVLYKNFESSMLQRIAYEDILSGQLSHSSGIFIGKFPFIPNISHWGESIATVQARYLLREGKHREVIALLKDENGNPWDARREFFMATAFYNKGMPERALHYSQKAYALKPYYFPNIHLLTTLLDQYGRIGEIPPYLLRYLDRDKNNVNVWAYAAKVYRQLGEPDKALDLLKAAKYYHPDNALIDQYYRQTHHEKYIAPYDEAFSRAIALYQHKSYDAALKVLNQYIKNAPKNPRAYSLRAFAKYYLGAYACSIEDINHFFHLRGKEASLLNLRGACLEALGDEDRACSDFEAAMLMGNDSGKTNYTRLCVKE